MEEEEKNYPEWRRETVTRFFEDDVFDQPLSVLIERLTEIDNGNPNTVLEDIDTGDCFVMLSSFRRETDGEREVRLRREADARLFKIENKLRDRASLQNALDRIDAELEALNKAD